MDKKPFISLKVRISIGVVSVCLLLGLLAVLLMNRIARDIVDEEYTDDAEKISKAGLELVPPTVETQESSPLNHQGSSLFSFLIKSRSFTFSLKGSTSQLIYGISKLPALLPLCFGAISKLNKGDFGIPQLITKTAAR